MKMYRPKSGLAWIVFDSLSRKAIFTCSWWLLIAQNVTGNETVLLWLAVKWPSECMERDKCDSLIVCFEKRRKIMCYKEGREADSRHCSWKQIGGAVQREYLQL